MRTPGVETAVEPPAPVAVTVHAKVLPTSEDTSVTLFVVAPVIVTPLRCQLNAYDEALLHVPRLQVRVRPGRGVPVIVGAVTTDGGGASALPMLDAEPVPPRPVAVTTHDKVCPASEEVSRCVGAVSPVSAFPSRSH